MFRTWLIGFWGAAVLASGSLLAQETFKGGPEASGTAIRGSSNESAGAANRSRYRFHNGHWWYYTRGDQWSYWTGDAWARYDRQGYGEWFNRQFRPSSSDVGSQGGLSYGRRSSGTVQREKNESRGEGSVDRRPANSVQREKNEPRSEGSVDRRPANSVQREKNDSRGGDFGSLGRRPAGTVQHEKNSTRGGED